MAKFKYPNAKFGGYDFYLDELDTSIGIIIKLPTEKPPESTKQAKKQEKREKGGSVPLF